MPNTFYSRGHKKKPGSNPVRGGSKPPPSRQSGGTSGDLSIPGYVPETPIVPYNPGAPATPAQRRIRSRATPPPSSLTDLAGGYLLQTLNDLLTPGPTTREIAEAASRLGVKPISDALDAVGDTVHEAAQIPRQLARLPKQRVDSFLGRETLGTPMLGEILRAASERVEVATKGKNPATAVMTSDGRPPTRSRVQVNKRGELTVPSTRKAVRDLQEAKARAARSGAPIGQLAQQFPELSPRWLRALGAAQRKTGTPAALLAGILSQESDFGRSTLPGVHSGRNFAGAAGPFQIGNDPNGMAGNWWGENMGGANIYDVEDAAMGAGKYLQEVPSTPASKNPDTWRDAAFSYNHADWYANDVVREALARRSLNKLGRPADPGARADLRAAEGAARRVGIDPKAFVGGVRADAPQGDIKLWGGSERGPLEFASWMTEEQKNVNPEMMRLGRAISGIAGVGPLEVISGFRPGSTTESGSPDRHSQANALDIAADATSPAGKAKGDKIAEAAGIAAGVDPRDPEFRAFLQNGGVFQTVSPSGYDVEIIWNTPAYGGHLDHVHTGIEPTELALKPEAKKMKGPYAGSRKIVSKILGQPVWGDKEEGHSETGDHDPSQPNAYAQDIGSAFTEGNPAEGEPGYTQDTLNKVVRNLRKMGADVPDLTLGSGDWEGNVQGYQVELITTLHGSGPHIHLGARWTGETPPPGTYSGVPGGYSGGLSSGGSLGSGGVATGGGAAPAAQAPLPSFVGGSEVPISELLQTLALEPQLGGGEEDDELGLIDRILAGGRV